NGNGPAALPRKTRAPNALLVHPFLRGRSSRRTPRRRPGRRGGLARRTTRSSTAARGVFPDDRGRAPLGTRQGMTMAQRRGPQAQAIGQVRTLLAAAARRANQVKSAAEQTLDCLAAFAGKLSRLGEPGAVHDAATAAAAARYAVAVCRGSQALL